MYLGLFFYFFYFLFLAAKTIIFCLSTSTATNLKGLEFSATAALVSPGLAFLDIT